MRLSTREKKRSSDHDNGAYRVYSAKPVLARVGMHNCEVEQLHHITVSDAFGNIQLSEPLKVDILLGWSHRGERWHLNRCVSRRRLRDEGLGSRVGVADKKRVRF